jgi:hypothetical protein
VLGANDGSDDSRFAGSGETGEGGTCINDEATAEGVEGAADLTERGAAAAGIAGEIGSAAARGETAVFLATFSAEEGGTGFASAAGRNDAGETIPPG